MRIMANGEMSLPLLPFVVDVEIFLAYIYVLPLPSASKLEAACS
jgi:hypothetical protein